MYVRAYRHSDRRRTESIHGKPSATQPLSRLVSSDSNKQATQLETLFALPWLLFLCGGQTPKGFCLKVLPQAIKSASVATVVHAGPSVRYRPLTRAMEAISAKIIDTDKQGVAVVLPVMLTLEGSSNLFVHNSILLRKRKKVYRVSRGLTTISSDTTHVKMGVCTLSFQ